MRDELHLHTWLLRVLLSDCRRNSQIFLDLREGGTEVPTSAPGQAPQYTEVRTRKHLTGLRCLGFAVLGLRKWMEVSNSWGSPSWGSYSRIRPCWALPLDAQYLEATRWKVTLT